MITEMKDLPGGVLGFSLEGTVSAQDYYDVLIPVIEKALHGDKKLRLLMVAGPDFKGYAPGAMWDDTAFGVRHFFDFSKIAFVTDNDVYGAMARAAGFLMPAMVDVFAMKDLDAAKAWLAD